MVWESLMVGKARISCFGCQARHTTEWCALNDAELARLDTVKLPHEYDAGDTLFQQGEKCEGIFCVKSGLVGIRKLDAVGNSALVKLCCPGETIGFRAFLRKSDHRTTAEMMMPGVVCFIERATVRGLLEQNPNLSLRFLDHTVRDADEFEDRYFESVNFTVHMRLLNLLMVLYERFGHLDEQGEPLLELPLARQDLAAMIGTSPESMSRTIAKMQRQGLARFEGRSVRFHSIDSLVERLPTS